MTTKALELAQLGSVITVDETTSTTTYLGTFSANNIVGSFDGAVDINSGTIDGTVIGGSTPATISGTTGSFSGDFTVDTNVLFVDAANNRVGVGTNAPAHRFSVQTTSGLFEVRPFGISSVDLASTGSLRLVADTAAVRLNLNGTDRLSVITNETLFNSSAGTEVMRIDSSGRLGIGTSSPAGKLHVSGGSSGAASTALVQVESSGNSQITFLTPNTATASIFFGDPENNSVGRISYDHSVNALSLRTVGSERLRIDSSGNVGIGTSSPTEKLDVAGYFKANSLTTVGQGIELTRGDGNAFNVRIVNSNNTAFVHRATEHIFSNTGETTEFMRVDTSGRLGIGTSSPRRSLEVSGAVQSRDSADSTVFLRMFADSVSQPVININTGGSLRFAHSAENFTSFVERMRIDPNGRLGIGTENPGGDGSFGQWARLDIVGNDGNIRIANSEADLANKFGRLVLRHHIAAERNSYLIGGLNTSTENIIQIGGGSATNYQSTEIRLFTAANNTSTGSSERMRITSAGNVGIGTTTPATALDVKGTVTSERLLVTSASDPITITTAVVNNFTPNITSSHSRGTNETPTETLAGDRILGILARAHTGTEFTGFSASIQFHADSSGSNGGTHIRFETAPTGSAVRSQRMRITPDGNVAIGTTTAESRLHVNDTSAFPVTISRNGGTNANTAMRYLQATTSWYVGANSSNDFSFRYNNANLDVSQFAITSSGDVKIFGNNATTDTRELAVESAGYAVVRINGDTGNVSGEPGGAALTLRVDGTSTSPNAVVSYVQRAGDSGIGTTFTGTNDNSMLVGTISNAELLFGRNAAVLGGFYNDNTFRLFSPPDAFPSNNSSGSGVSFIADGRYSAVVQNGSALNIGRHSGTGAVAQFYYEGPIVGTISVTASATAYNTSSDYRLKEDVQPMVGASDRVLALNPVNFAWKIDGSRTDGFLAHEAQTVVPEAVTGEKDGEEMQAIDQSKLVPLLTAALQEALKRIEALEAK